MSLCKEVWQLDPLNLIAGTYASLTCQGDVSTCFGCFLTIKSTMLWLKPTSFPSEYITMTLLLYYHGKDAITTNSYVISKRTILTKVVCLDTLLLVQALLYDFCLA